MAAGESTSSSNAPITGVSDWPGPRDLQERLDEEIARAERHGTPLSCLLVVVDNLEEMVEQHGAELREQTLAYVAGALRRELRRFDRVGMPSDHELLILLPGADSPRAEMVARRVLDRLRAIKVEAKGERQALRVSVGLSAWSEAGTAQALIAAARAAAARVPKIETLPAAEPDLPRPTGPPWEPPPRRS
jgi:two-component system cell cycle response regulator